MNTPTIGTTPSQTIHAPLRLAVHGLVAALIGIISPFTALAWPFALLVGMVLGSTDAARMRGERIGLDTTLAAAFIGAIGVLGMLVFGAIIGGLIAIPVAVLAAFSEKAAAHASPIDRGVARIILVLVPLVLWLFVFPLLGMDVDIRVGG